MEYLNYLVQDWQVLLKIILSDVILSVDNALVIALVCAGLKQEHQSIAMKVGMSVAVFARIFFLLIAFILVQIPLLKLLAGLWLVKLGWDMTNHHDSVEDKPEKKTSLKSAIIAIVVADIMMSLDNVLAVVGASGDGEHVLFTIDLFGKAFHITDSYPIAIVGVLVSIPILLFASKRLMKLVEKYPVLNTIGAMLIAFIGIEMAVKDELFESWVAYGSQAINSSVGIVQFIVSLLILALFYSVTYLYKVRGK